MQIKITNINTIEDFMDASFRSVSYLTINQEDILQKKPFIDLVNKFPLLHSTNLVISCNKCDITSIDNTLSQCNGNIIELNKDASEETINHLIESGYIVWTEINNESDFAKCDKVDTILIDFQNLSEFNKKKAILNKNIMIKIKNLNQALKIRNDIVRSYGIEIDLFNKSIGKICSVFSDLH